MSPSEQPPIWVTAIMPCYNHAEFVAQAMESVQRQVDELIVVDDASTDYSVREIYRTSSRFDTTRFVSKRANTGPAEAINAGWKATLEAPIVPSTFPHDRHWVTWVSADNVMHEDWIGTLERHMTPTTGALYSAFLKFTWPPDDTGAISGQKKCFTPHEPDKLINKTGCYYGPAFLVRRDVWDKAGPQRTSIAHDYAHWLRIEEVCWEMGLDIVGVDEVLSFYRVHENRLSSREGRNSNFECRQFAREAHHRRAMKGITALDSTVVSEDPVPTETHE